MGAAAAKDDLLDLRLEVEGGAVGAHEGLFVHADDGGIECGLAVLGGGEEQNAAAGAGSIHGGLDEGVAADGDDDGIGAPAFAFAMGDGDHILFAGIDRMVEAVLGGDAVALGIEVGGEDFGAGAGGEGGVDDADGALADDEDGLVGSSARLRMAL